jgi:hypothetical protein
MGCLDARFLVQQNEVLAGLLFYFYRLFERKKLAKKQAKGKDVRIS